MREPALVADDFELVRNQRRARLEATRTSPTDRAFDELRRATHPWPRESLHYIPTLDEEIAQLEALELEHVRRIHRELLGATDLEVTIVGDFPRGEVLRALGAAFAAWEPKVPYERVPMPVRPVRQGSEVIPIVGQTMAVVAQATTLALRDDDPDYAAIRLASWLFLEKSRALLANRLRHEESVSYYVGGGLSADSIDERAALYGFAICSPGNAERARELMAEEFTAWIRGEFDEAELAEAKRSYAGWLDINTADDDFLAEKLLGAMSVDRTLKFDSDLAARMDALSLEDVRETLDRRLGDARFFHVRAGGTVRIDSDTR
jgi:zinc protease